MNQKIDITLVVPCYNEEANLQKGVLDKIGNFVNESEHISKVLIIDDGSTDESVSIIKRYLKNFPSFELVKNQHQGKAFAVSTGIRNTKTPYVMFTDIDLATPIEESDKLIQQIDNNYQIIIGSRSSARAGAPLTRKIMAVGLIVIRDIILGLHGIKDTQCGFKLFKTSSAQEILDKLVVFKNGHTIQGSSVSAAFDLEFLFLAKKLGNNIQEISVMWRHVETKNVNFLRDSLETLRDMLKIRKNYLLGNYDI